MLAIPKFVFGRVKLGNLALILLVAAATLGGLFYFMRTNGLEGGLATLFPLAQYEPAEREAEEGPKREGEEVVAELANEFIEKAQLGDGLTHLARRSVDRHLNETGREIGSERRIYAEDHIQRALGGAPLSLGEEISISRDLVVEAINLSLELDSRQIENLEQYSLLVTAFN